MNIFESVYHAMRNVFMAPFKPMKKKRAIRKAREKEHQKMIEETMVNASALKKKETRELLQQDLGQEVDKSDLITFKYVVKNRSGQTIKSSFDAKSISEVEAFLHNEGYTIVSIEPLKKNLLNMEINMGGKLKAGELSFALTQLSTYIKAGIPLIDSVRILAKQTEQPNKRKIYERIVFDLVAGESFSKALENQRDIFPRLLINMVKTAEMTGDLPSTLDEMSEYYTSIDETKKQMISALTYPCIVLLMAIIVIIFVLLWVVPSFIDMFAEAEASLPVITQITIGASNFLMNNYLVIILVLLAVVVSFTMAYKNVKTFRRNVQIILMKTPIIGNIIIYNEVTMFTKTFSQLLTHSVHITDSMVILSKISNNEIFKEIIANTMNILSKGGKISESFRGHWAFPVVAYEMLVTGESTGQLSTMMEKVANHYSNLHKNAVTQVKSLIEPITICFLAGAVGFILLSIILPMFELYGAVGDM
ncbi:MAG: type II secretion system F family protein [Firmicutes bacterium]|nr:type II secretion system F family protein [Bacillota bacterium]